MLQKFDIFNKSDKRSFFCVWYAKCAKYLAFGTFGISVVDALTKLILEFVVDDFVMKQKNLRNPTPNLQ